MRHKRVSQLMRLALSIALIAALFLLGVYVYDMQKTLGHQLEARSVQYASALSQMKERVDARFLDLWQIVSVVEAEAELRPIRIESGGEPAWIKARDRFKALLITNQLLYDIGAYYRKQQFLINSSAVYHDAALRRVYYRYANLSGAEFIRKLNDISGDDPLPYVHGMDKIIHTNSQPKRVFTLMYPVPTSSLTPYATLVLQLDGDQLSSLLGDYQLGELAVITDKDGDVIVSSSDASRGPVSVPEDGAHLTMDGEEYALFQTYSRRMPFRYALLVPSRVLNSAPIPGDLMHFPLSAALAAAFLALAVILMRWVYSPMRALLHSLPQVGRRGSLFVDECQIIRERMDALSHEASENLTIVLETALTRLVSGGYPDLDEMLSVCARVNVTFSHAHFRVALIRTAIAPPIGPVRVEGAELYVVRESRANTLLCVLCSRGDDPQKLRRPFELLGPAAHCSLICVGQRVDDLRRLNESYWDASDALDRRLFHGAAGIYFSEDEVPDESRVSYPVDLLYELKRNVLIRDFTGITESLEALRRYVNMPDADGKIAQQAIRDVCRILNDRFDLPDRYADISEDGAPSADQLCALLVRYAEAIYAYGETPDPGGTPLIENVLLYIDEHLEDPNLSMRSVAAAFQMKESAFSQMFKRHMNRNYMEYSNALKIKRARQLLTDSPLTIEEIAARLGYSTSSNFSRMFKAAVQLTPSQFRQYVRPS